MDLKKPNEAIWVAVWEFWQWLFAEKYTILSDITLLNKVKSRAYSVSWQNSPTSQFI